MHTAANRPPKSQKATLGGGCFWCLEAAYQMVDGVEKVVSGYAGGTTDNPTYDQVAAGRAGHAEVVQLDFDPAVIGFADLLDIFWVIHDPTTPDRQGKDIGPQYRSIILYADEEQRAAAEQSKSRAAKLCGGRLVTQIEPLHRFYPAEEYHRNYYRKNPEAGYCRVVINPKLAKLREKFAARLRSGS